MSHIKNTLAKFNFRPKKRLGQNFLLDSKALETICDTACGNSPGIILEIGAGIGNLSILLAQKTEKLYLVEKDSAFAPILNDTLKNYANTKMFFSDILDFDLKSIFDGRKITIVGNLPYYITSPILFHLLSQKDMIDRIIITVQKEVGLRIVAKPGTKDFGRLSCVMQFYTAPRLVEIFPRRLFSPAPAVDSSLLELKVLERPSVEVKSEEQFLILIKTMFQHRRKTLLNGIIAAGGMNLSKETMLQAIKAADIEPMIRAEQIGLAEMARLADEIQDRQKKN